MSKSLTILVSGMVAGDPGQGGASWAILQYLLGFSRLGHDVHLIEPVKSIAGADYFHRIAAEFGMAERMTLLTAGAPLAVDRPYRELVALAARADVLFNVSGMLTDRELFDRVPLRVYMDLDPAFIQLWHTQGVDMRFAGHTHFVTVGLNVGRQGCDVPTCGRDWITTLPPVDLERWPVADAVSLDAFTTIANWRGYGSIEHFGKHYGQKAHSLREIWSLPKRTGERFVLALSIDPGEVRDLAALRDQCWEVIEPAAAAGNPADYRQFVRSSRAEFGLTKSGYVVSRCGWFSDRSACYLASGRPVVAQDTGVGAFLPTGEGFLTFGSEDEAVQAVASVRRDYRRHAGAARRFAEEYLDSDRVLTHLLSAVGAA